MLKSIRKFIYRLQRRAAYKEFINSPAWDVKRREALRRAGYRCERCGIGNVVLQVHHKNYDRFGGNEWPSDLQVLCIPHHRQADWERKQAQKNKSGRRKKRR